MKTFVLFTLYYVGYFKRLLNNTVFLPKNHRKETKKVIGQLPLHTVKHGEKVILSLCFVWGSDWWMFMCLRNIFFPVYSSSLTSL